MIRPTVSRLALAALVAGIVAAALPSSAPAFSWQSFCLLRLQNDTNLRFRTINFLPGALNVSNPWWPTWWIDHRLNPGRDDIPPGGGSPVFESQGTPFNGWGCNLEGIWESVNPRIGQVDCSVWRPSAGYGRFDCWAKDLRPTTEDFVATISWKVDDGISLGGTVTVTRKSGGGAFGSPPVPPGPKKGSPLLVKRDLRGRGWRTATAIETRELMASLAGTKSSRGCAGAKQTDNPSSTAGWLFLRKHNGDELILGTALRFASPVQARQAQTVSLSPAAARCLARAISTKKGLTASARRLPFGKLGDGSSAYRIVIHSSAPKGSAFLDLVSLRKGRGTALIVFYAEDHQMAASIERVAAQAVVRRIKR